MFEPVGNIELDEDCEDILKAIEACHYQLIFEGSCDRYGESARYKYTIVNELEGYDEVYNK